jgi:hypothetical protein
MTDDLEHATTDSGATDSAKTAVKFAPSKALTIPAKRLAGSPACLNCGTELAGPFCHYCGQPDKNFMRFFPVLLRELLADFLDFDSRFARTMRPLLFHPGKLTRDYLDGRRFRYTPPLRLYIFASMAFFLIAAMLASNAITTNDDGEIFSFGTNSASVHIDKGLEEAVKAGEMTAEEAAEVSQKVQESLASIDPGKTPDSSAENAESKAGTDVVEEDSINLNGEPWDRETNPFIVPGVPDFINDWINNEIEESPAKGREIEANPNIIVDKILDVLPIAVFIMLPLVALLFKFWYLFSGHYYVEHLIHALHNHAFLFVVFILLILADAAAGLKEPETEGIWTQAAGWVDVVLAVWIPLYLLISLKKVYRQGWMLTLAKFSLVGISYLLLLTLVTSAAALAGFVLL